MDAQQALADLTEISSQVRAAVLLDTTGQLVASTHSDETRATALAEACRDLLGAADEARRGDRSLTQLEAATRDGSVFVVREGDRVIAATTGPAPTVGLVFYDLKTCLRTVAAARDGEATPKKRAPRKRAAKAAPEGNGDAEA